MKGVDVENFKNYFISIIEEFDGETKVKEEINLSTRGDEVDLYNSEKEHSLELKLRGRNLHYIKKVKAALQRIEEGHFGECAECGVEIGMNRLTARPTAHLCIGCKEEQERDEGKRVDRMFHPSQKKRGSFINVKKMTEESFEKSA
ncbi:MAG: TraR/DksA C4-type zinc finger protein [Bacteriovoracaceae bacterium]|nr:TraR/DksA C4-type zinc finger protein [Bacteriovoracaceae bacterium]